MMNVPIIFYAARETGDDESARASPPPIAARRATRSCGPTARRPTKGFSIWRPASFCGRRRIKGLRGDSAWARGLAWSLYGYSKCYASDRRREFLRRRRAECRLLAHPSAGGSRALLGFSRRSVAAAALGGAERISAGAIAASGLLDLARQTESLERAASAIEATALAMLDALCQPEYLASRNAGLGRHSQARRLSHGQEPGRR